MNRKPSLFERLISPFCDGIIKYIGNLIHYYRLLYKFGDKLVFNQSNRINLKSTFEGCNKIYQNTIFDGSMGYGTYIGPNCQIKAHIGRFTSIAPFVRINEGTHPLREPYVATSPMFFSTRGQSGMSFANRMTFDDVLNFPTIGNDVWICENVFISGGITIGDGAVVLPGAVVSDDIPPYAIAGGVPAKVISYRYDEATREFLLKEKWWNRDVEWLKRHWEIFSDIDTFKKVCHEESNA